MNPDLFRANALEQLSSPEPMDEPALITGFRYWIALAGLFVLLGGAGIWAFQGTIESNVSSYSVLTVSEHGIEAVAYIPSARAEQVAEGMEARVLPISMRWDQYGFIRGKIIEVSSGVAAPVDWAGKSGGTAARGGENAFTKIRVVLQRDAVTQSGLKWSVSRGSSFSLPPGTACTMEITVAKRRAISLLFPYLKKTGEDR
jgi:hypothetical protein